MLKMGNAWKMTKSRPGAPYNEHPLRTIQWKWRLYWRLIFLWGIDCNDIKKSYWTVFEKMTIKLSKCANPYACNAKGEEIVEKWLSPDLALPTERSLRTIQWKWRSYWRITLLWGIDCRDIKKSYWTVFEKMTIKVSKCADFAVFGPPKRPKTIQSKIRKNRLEILGQGTFWQN